MATKGLGKSQHIPSITDSPTRTVESNSWPCTGFAEATGAKIQNLLVRYSNVFEAAKTVMLHPSPERNKVLSL